jgi:hypothetical protein
MPLGELSSGSGDDAREAHADSVALSGSNRLGVVLES